MVPIYIRSPRFAFGGRTPLDAHGCAKAPNVGETAQFQSRALAGCAIVFACIMSLHAKSQW